MSQEQQSANCASCARETAPSPRESRTTVTVELSSEYLIFLSPTLTSTAEYDENRQTTKADVGLFNRCLEDGVGDVAFVKHLTVPGQRHL